MENIRKNIKQTTIDAEQRISINLKSILQYKYLLYILCYRAIKIKYAQTVLGIFWSIIVPLITILFLTIIFNKIGNVESEKVPHLLFTSAGYLVWSLFMNSVSDSGSAFLDSQDLVTNIYFPRILIPISKVILALVEFTIIFLFISGAIILLKDVALTFNMIFLPLIFCLIIFTSFSTTIWVSALSVRYRDFKFIIPFVIRSSLLLSPIAFSSIMIPEKIRFLYYLNPIAGLIDLVRWSIFDTTILFNYALQTIIISIILFITGILYFQKVEKVMADII